MHGAVDASSARNVRLKRDMDDVLARLYDLLIAPVGSWLTDRRRLIIVPSGDLHSVPFAALLDGNRYLVDRMAITTAPGMSILAGMHGDLASTFRSERILVAGVPDEAAPGLEKRRSASASGFHWRASCWDTRRLAKQCSPQCPPRR